MNSYQYRGEQFDTSLGMYYLRARYFVSRTGRFLQRDQFEGLSYVPKTMNAYVYGLGNPVLYWDPTGLAAEAPITVGLSAATLGLAPEIEVAGTLTVQNGVGLATIENIQAVGKGFSVLRQITSLAIEFGAEDLWIQGVLANEGFGVLGSAVGRFGISAIVESGPYTLLRIVIP